MTETAQHDYYFPEEPSRIESRHVEQLLVHANTIDASDITIQTNRPIFAEIYGKLYKITKRSLTNSEVSDILNALYGANGTTQILRGDDLDTHYEVRPSRTQRYRHRVNAVGCFVDGQNGIQITIRTIPLNPPKLSDLELPDAITAACAPEEGVVYVTGATGSGKSTLLAAIIKELAEQPQSNRKILTYESPIEFVYDNINAPNAIISQTEIPKHLPTFSAGIRNALRRKPHAIMVGESRDRETISSVVEAALTGHPVYTTLHSNGVAETIRRLVGAFPKEERMGRTIDIIETMRLIVSQKLLPSLDGKRVAVREYLVFNENIRDQLLSCPTHTVTEKTRELVNQYGQTMNQDIEKKYQQGLISDRIYKVLTARQKHEAI
jgi:defect in organelle trafficking protein DotB